MDFVERCSGKGTFLIQYVASLILKFLCKQKFNDGPLEVPGTFLQQRGSEGRFRGSSVWAAL